MNTIVTKFISSIENAPETTVLNVENISVKASKLLPLLEKYTINGKYNYVPVNKVPEMPTPGVASKFIIGSMELIKELNNTTATLIDETDEDTPIDAMAALEHILGSQVRMQSEALIVEKLVDACEVVTGPIKSDMTSAISLISKFTEGVQYSQGTFLFVCNMTNYLQFMSTLNSGAEFLINEGVIKFVPVLGMENNKLMVLHTAGVGYGLNVYGVEEERSNNSSELVASFNYAGNVVEDYGIIVDVEPPATTF